MWNNKTLNRFIIIIIPEGKLNQLSAAKKIPTKWKSAVVLDGGARLACSLSHYSSNLSDFQQYLYECHCKTLSSSFSRCLIVYRVGAILLLRLFRLILVYMNGKLKFLRPDTADVANKLPYSPVLCI